MVKYITKNKVFVFLLVYLLGINVFLFLQLNSGMADSLSINNDNTFYTPVETTFEVRGDFIENQKEVTLSWTLPSSSKKIKKASLLYNDKELRDVTNSYNAVLKLSEYGLQTGNAKFTVRLFYEDGTELDKTVYVYINEVFDIKVTTQASNKGIIYMVTYWYDKNHPSSVPRVNYNDSRVIMNYLDSSLIDAEANYEHILARYELDFSNFPNGHHEVNLQWVFTDFRGLSYDYYSSFEVTHA